MCDAIEEISTVDVDAADTTAAAVFSKRSIACEARGFVAYNITNFKCQ